MRVLWPGGRASGDVRSQAEPGNEEISQTCSNELPRMRYCHSGALSGVANSQPLTTKQMNRIKKQFPDLPKHLIDVSSEKSGVVASENQIT